MPAATAYDVNGIHRVYAQPKLIQGHAWTLFVGGQSCPFCASMRWPFVKALSRFGTFSGLGEMHSQLGVDGFDFSLPLHWFAWRRSAGMATAQGMGLLGTLFSIGSLSCCAPLMLPGLLGLRGFSGTSLLALNLRLHQFRLPLTVLALAFLGLSFSMGLANVTRSCDLRRGRRLPAA